MRDHDLLTKALGNIIIQQVILIILFQNILPKYDKLLEDGIGEKSVATDSDCLALHSKYLNICNDLSFPALNKLWILYIKMDDLLYMNLIAERSGNWSIYLHSLRLVLTYFAGTGHNN